MNDIKEGGPAFPALARYGRSSQLESALQQDGMTLRDYFAAKAIVGICAETQDDKSFYNYAAKHAYEMADAMIKAREAK
jgi:hypothetical protein